MNKVVLYSTNCPRCRVLEKKLNEKNIIFELVNDEDVMIEKGFMTAPMMEIDGSLYDFKNAVDWINGLE